MAILAKFGVARASRNQLMTLLLPNCVTLKVVETLTSVTFVCYVINKSTIY